MLVHQTKDFENKINFTSSMSKDKTFSENFLANILSISLRKLRRSTSVLINDGEIMVYGDENSREFKLEDIYIILTKYTKKEQIKVLDQFKMEFFRD